MNSKIIRKHVLKNAVLHNGKSQAGAVIPKLLGEEPGLKKNLKALMQDVQKIVNEVNKMGLKSQEAELLKIDKHALDKKVEVKDLPEIKGIIDSKCSFRLPPGPEKQLHIGHALSYLLNYYYAKRYNGKLVLRFEDSNPEKCKQEFVDGNKADLKALGIEWDEEYYLSDNMSDYLKYCDILIKSCDAYACKCPASVVQDLRLKRERCNCADKNVTENLRDWNKMKYGTYREGECVVRLKGDMKNKNSVMWDPAIFRTNTAKHYRQGNRFKVWPLYDFTASIEDAKITHVLRDANWTQRVELQDFIRKKLGLKTNPVNVLYSRYQVEGGITQGREIRALVDTNKVTGYDDLRLATVKSLLRRGLLPEALMELLKEVGITKSKTTIQLEKLYTINRRLLDRKVNHYFFAEQPILLVVNNAPNFEAGIPINPYSSSTRKVKTNGSFYINRSDAVKGLLRLKHAYNVEIKEVRRDKVVGEYVEEKQLKNIPIIQWVSEGDYTKIKVLEARLKEDSLIVHEGYAEKIIDTLPVGVQVQFERFGFCKKEENEWVYTHD